jgi:hypothetical protein
MTWQPLPVFVAGTPPTSDQLNALSTDLGETAPAKATAAGQFFVSTGPNALAARTPVAKYVVASEATGSFTMTDLTTPGPACTVTSGAQALMLMNANLFGDRAGQTAQVGIAITGATTSPPTTTYLSATSAAQNYQVTAAGVRMAVGLTPGVNTFTMKYCQSGNAAGAVAFDHRFLTVLPF